MSRRSLSVLGLACAVLLGADRTRCATQLLKREFEPAVVESQGTSRAGQLGTLTFMSFNIRAGNGVQQWGLSPWELRDDPKDLTPVAQTILSEIPDVVGLQEVQGIEQARELAAALDAHLAYAPYGTPSQHADWWGVALLSRLPILGAWRYPLYEDAYGVRSLLFTNLDCAGEVVTVVTLHNPVYGEKTLLVRRILNAIELFPHGGGPVVLLGDFNLLPTDPALDLLWERFADPAESLNGTPVDEVWERGTLIGPFWDWYYLRIDYVMFEQGRFSPQAVRLVDEAYWSASDHLATVARARLTAN